MACWFKPVALATGTKQGLFSFVEDWFGSVTCIEIGLKADVPRAYVAYRGYTGEIFEAEADVDLSTGVWYHLLGIFEWVSEGTRFDPQIYLNGGNWAQVEGSGAGLNGSNYTWIGRTYGGYASAEIAEVAHWNYDSTQPRWTAAEAQMLAAGYSPRLVRPQHQKMYLPLVRNASDWKWGVTLTAGNAPTVSDHPRVLYPARVHGFDFSPGVASSALLMQQHHHRGGL
jgi:hypothetical protein